MATEKRRKLIITGPEMGEPLEIPMEQAGVATIGRGSDNTLRVKHPLVSRQHAEIRATPAACHLIDLGSTYGTQINGERIEANRPALLQDGDVVELGPYRVTFEEKEVTVAAQQGTTRGSKPIKRRPRPPKEPPIPPGEPVHGSGNGLLPPGLSYTYSRYLQYLPEIYHTRFMGRFLALFESIWTPLEWQVENFDLYLSPRTAPADFLPWLANWFDVVFDESWQEEQRRQLLLEAHEIYARRGTKGAMERLLQIYTGREVEIDDVGEDLAPFTFVVRIPRQEAELNRVLVERLIDTNKPAHTSYKLLFAE